jgi:hypothetical protein
MKNMKTLFALFFALLQAPSFLKSQTLFTNDMEKCITPKFEDKCTSILPSTDYVYLSSWDYRSDESIDIKVAVLLKKNILYAFNICEGSGKENMILSLSDGDSKLLLTSVDKKTKKNDRIIYFRPTVSGKYFISTLFNKDEENCSLIMLGMIKKDSYTEKILNKN